MIIVLIISISILGYQISSQILDRESFYEKIFLGFLLGSGILTLIIFLSSLLGINFTFKNNFSILLFLNTLCLIIALTTKRLNFNFELTKVKINKTYLIILLIISILFLSSFVFNIYWPVRDWDALTLYDFRGKYFSINGDISSVFKIHRYYLGYPLYTSIMHGLVYVFGFNNPMFIYTILYVSFVTLLFFGFSRVLSTRTSLIASFCIAFIPEVFEHSMISYTNLPYTIFIILGYLYLLNYNLTNKTKFLIASGFLVGLSTWIRSSDPFWIAPILLTLYYSFKKKSLWTVIIYIIIILIFKLPWTFFVGEISKSYTITSSNNLDLLFTSGINKYVNQVFEVLPYVYNYVVKPQIITLSMFILSLFLVNKKSKPFVFQTTYFIFTNILIIAGGVYLYSIIYEKWSVIGDSVSRMSMFLTPLIYIHVAGVVDGLLNKKLK